MSTPKLPDEVMKLIDRGAIVVLRKSGMGTYLAVSVSPNTEAHVLVDDAVDKALGWYGEDPDGERSFGDNMPGVVETDDFTPSQALYRLTEKATTGRIVHDPDPEE